MCFVITGSKAPSGRVAERSRVKDGLRAEVIAVSVELPMSDDLLNMRRRVSGALYHDRFSASEAEHLLAVIFQAVGADAIGSDPDADLSGTNAIARVNPLVMPSSIWRPPRNMLLMHFYMRW
jgi:hypothetical protein